MEKSNLPKLVFITEAIRRDAHAPLKNFKKFEIVHFYLQAPYGDMTEEDLKGTKQVKINDLLSQIILEKPDIIQGVEPFGSKLGLKLSYISLKATIATGAKLVCPVLENRPIKDRFSLLQRIVLRLFCPKFFRACDRIFALNKGAVKNIQYYYKKAKIVTGIVWGVWGVDTEFFRPTGKKDKNLIIYVGRLVSEKGLMFLLEAFRGARNKIPELKLNLVGRGPLKDKMEQYLEDNLISDSVNFVGLVKNVDLPKYFSSASLSVYPSITDQRWEEQVGTVNFQSLACSTPVLTTKSGAIPEYIEEGEGAMLVPERSAKDLQQAMVRFFSNQKLRDDLTRNAREFSKKYDIKKEVGQAEKVLLEILDEN